MDGKEDCILLVLETLRDVSNRPAWQLERTYNVVKLLVFFLFLAWAPVLCVGHSKLWLCVWMQLWA
jgi:hypothetical protein